jgi:DNA-binding HxlR family transcriptional regulator
MSERDGYGQFCPVSMASEVLCSRWTTLVVREFLCGSTRFNELRRGLPKMSPALLSKRLKELEQSGVITVTRGANGASEYLLTAAGEELRPLIIGLGTWAQRWMESRLSLKNLDPSLLMWDMRRSLDTERLPPAVARYSFCTRSSRPQKSAGGLWSKTEKSISAILIRALTWTLSLKVRSVR